jgi:hypothetical protein
MKAAARLNYLALGCAIAPALLVAVSCGSEGAERAGAGTALASPTPVPTPTSVPPPRETVMPISEGDAVWDWIAANSQECEPILRPTYLPSDLSHLSLNVAGQERGCPVFGVNYTDSAGQARLLVGGGPWFNPPLPGPDSLQEEVEVRATTGHYQLQDTTEPLGVAFLTWLEPGRWGKPGSQWYEDFVEYIIFSEGFSKEELLKVANSLEPVEP